MFEIGAVLREGWEKFKGNAGTLIGSAFIFILIPIVVSAGSGR